MFQSFIYLSKRFSNFIVTLSKRFSYFISRSLFSSQLVFLMSVNLLSCYDFWTCVMILLLSFERVLLYPLLGRARFRGWCWAAIHLSHRPELSGRAVHGEGNGLDIGGRHGRRFVLLRHTHRSQRRLYPICTSRSGNIRHRCGSG